MMEIVTCNLAQSHHQSWCCQLRQHNQSRHLPLAQMGCVQVYILCWVHLQLPWWSKVNNFTNANLFGPVANFHCQVPSRIPNANYNDSLSSETLWILIISTMEVLSFELLNSYKRRKNNYWVMVYLIYLLNHSIVFAVCRVYAYILHVFSFYSSALSPFWIFLHVSFPIAPESNLVISLS